MTPTPPSEAPHEYREETIEFSHGPITLVGVLSLPVAVVSPYPAIAFIHGSGPASRFEWGPHRDAFARCGFATLTWDKPGVGDSTGDWTTQTGIDRAREGLAALSFLRNRHDIGAQRVGLCGASQAGWIMPLMCSLDKGIAFMIAISVPVGTGAAQNAYDLEHHLLADGWSKADALHASAFYTFMLDLARNHIPYDLFIKAVSLMKREPWFESYASWFQAVKVWDDPDAYEDLQRNPDIYPPPPLEAISCPVLALFGGQDLNVNSAQSVEAYTTRLQQALHRDVTIKVYSGADHSISLPGEDGTPGFAPGYFELMEEWLHRQVAPEPQP
jgi:pimeloyl-ACP methyl ester carboxylesterase